MSIEAKTNKELLAGNLLTWYFSLVLFGYSVVSVICAFLNLSGTPIAITYRAFLIALGGSIVVMTYLRNGRLTFPKRGLPFLFFWLVYSFVLIRDISFFDIRMGYASPFYLYSFAFGSSFFSFLVLFLAGKHFSFSRASVLLFWRFIVFSNLLILSYLAFSGGVSLEALATRASIDTESGNVLNPITIGRYGCYSILSSLSLLLFLGKKSISLKVGVLCGLVVGVLNLFLGASRGPMLVCGILLLPILYYYYVYSRVTPVKLLKSSTVLGGIIGSIVFIVIPFLSSLKISVFFRLSQFFEQKSKGGKEIRDYEWEAAINQFIENPLLGDKYLNNFDNYYPHNVYLEVLMSTGVVGGAFFFAGLSLVIVRIVGVFNRKDLFRFVFFLIALSILLFRVTSGALHQAPDFWAALGIVASTKNASEA